MRSIRAVSLLLIATAVPWLDAAAQDCASLPRAPGITGYQLRRGSDRCEGIYVSPVSGGGLQLLSLTYGRVAYEPERDAMLFVQAPRGAASGLRLQGSAIPLGLYYRLDAALGDSKDFQLPLAPVIRPSGIGAGDLGLLAYRDAGAGRRVFVPVHVAVDPGGYAPPQSALAVLRPDSDIRDVRWRLTAAGTGAPGEFRALASATGPVPSGQRLEIPLPAFGAANEATLELRYVDLGGRERASRFQITTR